MLFFKFYLKIIPILQYLINFETLRWHIDMKLINFYQTLNCFEMQLIKFDPFWK